MNTALAQLIARCILTKQPGQMQDVPHVLALAWARQMLTLHRQHGKQECCSQIARFQIVIHRAQPLNYISEYRHDLHR